MAGNQAKTAAQCSPDDQVSAWFEDLIRRNLSGLDYLAKVTAPVASLPPAATFDPTLVSLAKSIYAGRRARASVLPAEILGEPGWDLLLDAFISYSEDRDICVSSACIAAAVPPTTGLRWIERLVSLGYLERTPDPKDLRKIQVRLTEWGCDVMTKALLRQIAAYRLVQE